MPSQNQKTLTKPVLAASLAMAALIPSRATTYDGDIIPEYAQGTPIPEAQFSPVAPDVQAMIRYGGGSQVDRYTGAASYSISLYTYSDRDFTIPVTLSYRGDGLRPGRNPGCAGTGWSLNVGGVITREVRGLPDEATARTYASKIKGDGSINNVFAIAEASDLGHGTLKQMLRDYNRRTSVDVFGFGARTASSGRMEPADFAYSGEIGREYILFQKEVTSSSPRRFETEPDLYRFSFMGISGTFVIGEDGRGIVLNSDYPAGEIRIDYNYNKVSPLRTTFTITTGDPVSYVRADYDILNLPRSLLGDGDYPAEYVYLADGTKVSSKMEEIYQGYYYVGPFVYRLWSDDYIPSEVSVRYGGGVITRDSEGAYSSVAYFRDHLGSTRVKVMDCGEVVGEYDYLPYGGLASYCPPSEWSNDYLFGGKELESAHNVSWYDSGARYQTTHGVFTSQDPLSEKYYSISPYAYCAGNPVNSVDVDGQMPQVVVGALIGATVEGVIAVVEGKTLREIGGAVVGGAIEGALVSLTGGISMFGNKVAMSVLTTGAASAIGSAASQAIGEGSIDAKQVTADAIAGVGGEAVSSTVKATALHLGGRMANTVNEKYSSKAMISSVEKEVKKEMRQVGINPAGKAGKSMIMREVKGRISAATEFELSIANVVKDTKVGDVTGGIVAHKISVVIYDKDE